MLISTYFLPIPTVKTTAAIASLLHQPINNVIDRPAGSSQGFIVRWLTMTYNSAVWPSWALLLLCLNDKGTASGRYFSSQIEQPQSSE